MQKELRGTFHHFTSFSFHYVPLLSYFSCVVNLELPCSQQIIRISPVIILLRIRFRSDNKSMEKHLYRGRVKGGGVFNLFPIPEVTIW
jgi:hypothetical protein